MIRMVSVFTLGLIITAGACSRNADQVDDPQPVRDEAVKEPIRKVTGPDHVGRIYHYVRSNIGGAKPEDVYVFRKRADILEVYKTREKCENAAFSTAEMNMNEGYARRITGGRLTPNAGHDDFAFLTYDPATKKISARIELPDAEPLSGTVTVGTEPWHLYDFDFASLTVTTPNLEPRADFAFGLPLVVPDADREEFLLYLGEAQATFRAEEPHNDRPAFRYALGGPAFGSFGGSLWLDAEEGHILDVETGIPNHLDYRDFKLELVDIDDGGQAAWTDLLTAHFEGCGEQPSPE